MSSSSSLRMIGRSLLLALFAISAPGLCGCEVGAQADLATGMQGPIVQGEELVLSNGVLRLAFAARSGELRAIDNLVSGYSLLPEGEVASRLPDVGLKGRGKARLRAFEYEVLEESAERQALRLVWTCDEGISIVVRAELERGAELAMLWPEVRNTGRLGVMDLTYPNFPRLETLGASAADDVLVHAFARGMLIRDPRRSLDLKHSPIAVARYPQAYNGMTHQLVDYYSAQSGGFFFATFDPHSTEKGIAIRTELGELAMTWSYRNWDGAPGAGMQLDFPFVIGANLSGDWYGAADHYREWALTTEWCTSRGPNVNRRRDGRAPWLYEDIGAATFGMSAAVDQSAWFDAYHELAGAPMFHVLGHDWLRGEGRGETRGEEPHELELAFSPANLRTIARNGDAWAVFLADLKTTFLPTEMAYEVGRLTIEVLPRLTPEACPKCELWQHLHVERAAEALAASGADSFYCDASAPNRELVCENPEHGHPRGRGRWMNDGFREMYAETRAHMSETCGRYTPLGVELMHEGLIDRFDYYQARNGGGFMGMLEGGFYRGLQLSGMAETVPVFSYIYHDYAPVALDGCGKLSERIGEVYYWMAARTLLQGSVFELNHEFSPPERFPGMRDVGQLHYREREQFEWIGPEHPANSPYDPAKGAFLAEVAAARTGPARDFLAYGRMLPPLEVTSEPIVLDFTYYNNLDWGGKANTLQYADQSGSFRTPRVLHSAWSFEGRLGLLFVNLSAEPTRAEIDLDLARYERYGIELGGEVEGLRKTTSGESPLSLRAGETTSLELPPRRVVLLEF